MELRKLRYVQIPHFFRINAGDQIELENNENGEKLVVDVEKTARYQSAKKLLEAEGTKNVLSGGGDLDQGIESISNLTNYRESIPKYGLIAIHVKPGIDYKTIVKKCKEWVLEVSESKEHLIVTGKCVKEIDENASDIVVISCLLHDIERAFKDNRNPPESGEYGRWDDLEYNLWHGVRSADFSAEFLRRLDCGEDMIQKVRYLIINHEVGGDYEQNLIKDADSLSFLQTQVDKFIARVPEKFSKEHCKDKFEWMYNRITLNKTKELALPHYKEALKKLEDLQ